MNQKHTCKLAVLSALILALVSTGCSAGVRKQASQHYDQAEAMATELMEARNAARFPVAGPIITDAPYVDVTPIDKVQREPLAFSRIFTMNTNGQIPMHVFASRVEGMTGVKVRYQTELQRGEGTAAAAVTLPASRAPLVVNGVTLPEVDSTVPVPTHAPMTAMPAPGVSVSYTGPLRGLFEQVAEQTGAHWRWDATRQEVTFYLYETEAFRLAAVAGTSNTKFELGRAQQAASGDATLRLADTEATHKTDGSIWKEVEATLSKLVGPKGVFQVSETTGMVVVRDEPSYMEAVRNYLNALNDSLSRQVDIEVTVYRVQVTDRDFKGLSWDVLFQTLMRNSRYAIGWKGVRPDVVSEGAASAVIRVPPTYGDGTPNRYGGSQLFLDALTTIGRASIVQRTAVLATNNRAAAAKFVKRNSYLAETVPTYASGGGTQVGTGAGLTPGAVETGLNLYLLPHVQEDGKRLLLRAMVSISTLDGMETGSSGESSIHLPQVSSREFAQEAWLRAGETLVLTGYDETSSGNTSKSPFGRAWALGGERTATRGQEILVVALTPVVSASRSRI